MKISFAQMSLQSAPVGTILTMVYSDISVGYVWLKVRTDSWDMFEEYATGATFTDAGMASFIHDSYWCLS